MRFPALVNHSDGTFTRFLALERCRGGKDFLQVLDIDVASPSALRRVAPAPCAPPAQLCYDPEWLALQKVNHENISFSWHPAKARVSQASKAGQNAAERFEFPHHWHKYAHNPWFGACESIKILQNPIGVP